MSTPTATSASHDFESPVAITEDGPRLIAGHCTTCGDVSFPRRAGCGACGAGTVERHVLPATGTLWTFTVQGFPPKSPPYVPAGTPEFEAFGVGYVEFEGQLRVEGRLSAADPGVLRIGAEMRVEALEVGERTLYAFAPVTAEHER